MIKTLYWDIDENLLHTFLEDPNQEHISFTLECGETYYTIIRPCAKRLIEWSRELLGAENVCILTTSTTEYAREINRLAGWNFPHEQIFARENIAAQRYVGNVAPHALANPNNILIDNLPPRANEDKISFIGIYKTVSTNYLQVRDYYGVNFPDDTFESKVVEFVLGRLDAEAFCS